MTYSRRWGCLWGLLNWRGLRAPPAPLPPETSLTSPPSEGVWGGERMADEEEAPVAGEWLWGVWVWPFFTSSSRVLQEVRVAKTESTLSMLTKWPFTASIVSPAKLAQAIGKSYSLKKKTEQFLKQYFLLAGVSAYTSRYLFFCWIVRSVLLVYISGSLLSPSAL